MRGLKIEHIGSRAGCVLLPPERHIAWCEMKYPGCRKCFDGQTETYCEFWLEPGQAIVLPLIGEEKWARIWPMEELGNWLEHGKPIPHMNLHKQRHRKLTFVEIEGDVNDTDRQKLERGYDGDSLLYEVPKKGGD